MSHLLNIACDPHDYTSVTIALSLDSLAEHRCALGIIFFKGLLDSKIDSPSLLVLVNSKVPLKTKCSLASFHIPHFNTNYLLMNLLGE